MSVVETILVYAGIPLAVVAFFAVVTLIPGREKRARYKPGQSWEHPPVWYEPHPAGGGSGSHAGHAALEAGSSAAAAGPLGGARGTW